MPTPAGPGQPKPDPMPSAAPVDEVGKGDETRWYALAVRYQTRLVRRPRLLLAPGDHIHGLLTLAGIVIVLLLALMTLPGLAWV